MAAAGLSLTSLPAGFPDGYISPYDQATQVWAAIGTYALLLGGIFTLVAAVMQRLGRSSFGAVLCVLLFLSLWLLDNCPRLDWCSTAAQQVTGIMLDDGQGG
jgi:hypothetical protein